MEADRRELTLAEAIERESATREVLEVLGRCAFELEPVFETVLAQAVRLCRADAGLIYVLEGDAYRVEVALGASQAYRDYISGVSIQAGEPTLVGRVGAERRTVEILDAPADPGYTMARALELGGFRTMLGVPMLEAELAPTTSSPSRSTPPNSSPACARCCASSATTTGCGASCRPRSPIWSRPTRACWRAIGARSRCSPAG